jgi:RHS repeat-associated protein
MTDATKSTVWQAVYEPYGRVLSVSGAATQNLGLPGQWFQLETGLNDNWHRHYDASLARYTTPDPLGFVDGPAIYAYAGGMPQLNTDRRGLNPAAVTAAICARFPQLCAGTAASIVNFCRKTLGGGGGGGNKEPKNQCDARFDNDTLRCRSIARGFDGRKGEAVCRQSASQRYSECLRGGPSAIRTPLAGVDFRL